MVDPDDNTNKPSSRHTITRSRTADIATMQNSFFLRRAAEGKCKKKVLRKRERKFQQNVF